MKNAHVQILPNKVAVPNRREPLHESSSSGVRLLHMSLEASEPYVWALAPGSTLSVSLRPVDAAELIRIRNFF